MCIHPSSAESERMFSQAKLVVTDVRNWLGPDYLSDVMTIISF